jgi:hypothetical protein
LSTLIPTWPDLFAALRTPEVTLCSIAARTGTLRWRRRPAPREFGDRRRLLVETAGGPAPLLDGAQLIGGDAGRYEYVFDASRVQITALLEQAAAQVLDVETHRAPIDDVIADIYETWQRDGHAGPGLR